MVNDKRIKEMIVKINSSSNCNEDIENAMKNSCFKEFANKCLEIIDPNIYYKEETDSALI